MKFSRTLRLALKSIVTSKGRSFLTMLGIIIGVAAVILIVGFGNGMEGYVTDSFKSMGTNLLNVNITGRGSTRSVSVDDMYLISDENIDLFSAMSPMVTVDATVKLGTTELDETTVMGVGEDYINMKMYELSNGRFIAYADNLSRSKVCTVGSYIEDELFSGDAIGQTLKINGNYFEIVGVLEESADNTEGSSDDYVYLPYTTAAKLLGTADISTYSYAMLNEEQSEESIDVLEGVLYKVFSSEDAYRVNSISEIIDTMTSMINIVVIVLSIIASISLLVGGVGIMNIMLVSVSERTREIGIRKALGAKRKDILFQFVIEAGTISAIGGFIGILTGYALSSVATIVMSMMMSVDIKVSPSLWSVALAFGVSAGIGILFGFLPARRAAYLNPIDALRYE